MLLRPLLLVSLLCVAPASCAFAQTLPPDIKPAPKVTMHRSQTGEPDASGWMLATSTEGGFSVRLPIKFNDYTADESAVSGPVLRSFSIEANSPNKTKFYASRIVYRDGAKTAQLFFARWEKGEGLPRDAKGIKPHRVGARRAVDYVQLGERDVAYARFLLLETDLLTMFIGSPRGLDATTQHFVAPFFDSLTISAK